jgi:hypothetical protein
MDFHFTPQASTKSDWFTSLFLSPAGSFVTRFADKMGGDILHLYSIIPKRATVVVALCWSVSW